MSEKDEKKKVQSIVVFDKEIFIAEGNEEAIELFENSIARYMQG